jgi:hypothetical protein
VVSVCGYCGYRLQDTTCGDKIEERHRRFMLFVLAQNCNVQGQYPSPFSADATTTAAFDTVVAAEPPRPNGRATKRSPGTDWHRPTLAFVDIHTPMTRPLGTVGRPRQTQSQPRC